VLVIDGIALIVKNGLCNHAVDVEKPHRETQAHEHDEAWQSISAIVAGVGWSLDVGLKAVPAVRELADHQERGLPAPPVVFGAAADGAGATPLMSCL
jgi:hypothetical protein